MTTATTEHDMATPLSVFALCSVCVCSLCFTAESAVPALPTVFLPRVLARLSAISQLLPAFICLPSASQPLHAQQAVLIPINKSCHEQESTNQTTLNYV